MQSLLSATALTPVAMTDDQIIQAGAKFLAEEEASAPKRREGWRTVGEALLILRKRHRADVAFGKALRDAGYGKLDRRRRADAMWLAVNWEGVQILDTTYSNPPDIRAAFNATLIVSTPDDHSDAIPAKVDTTPALSANELFAPWLGPSTITTASAPATPTPAPTTPKDDATPPPKPSGGTVMATGPGMRRPQAQPTPAPKPQPIRPDPATYMSHWPAETLAVSVHMVASTFNSHKDRDDASIAKDVTAFLRREGCKVEALQRLQRVLTEILKDY